MKVLVINTGSSSLKYQLIDMTNESVLAKGLCDRIGIEGSYLKQSRGEEGAVVRDLELKNHRDAIQAVINALVDPEIGVIPSMSEISAVGHRIVHGGEKFSSSAVINDEVMGAVKACIEVAPLHNPPNIIGIEACQQIMPGVPMVGVFDTAFHRTMPEQAYIYAIPYEMYQKYGIRKYGFHGTSHKFVAERAAELLGKPLCDLKIITCHLGNGSSVSAVNKGKCIDTSMGFTPLAGVPMGTRCGNIDPEIVTFLMSKENLDIKGISTLLNKKSGVLGVSGVSSDFRDLHDAADSGNKRAQLAIEIFSYGVKKVIGEYLAAMNGADAIVFTAGVGENNPVVRNMILKDMDFFGIKIDEQKNNTRGKEIDISAEGATVKTLVVPTNEELAIARETVKLLK